MALQPHFNAFFVSTYPSTVRALTLIVGDRGIAEDAAQVAYLKAHRKWKKVGRYDNPASWVKRVAISAARDELRSTKRRSSREQRATSAFLQHAPPADDTAALGDRTLQAMQQLPERQRTAVALHYLDDLSIADIADIMSISEGAVKSHLHDGRADLKQRLLEANVAAPAQQQHSAPAPAQSAAPPPPAPVARPPLLSPPPPPFLSAQPETIPPPAQAPAVPAPAVDPAMPTSNETAQP